MTDVPTGRPAKRSLTIAGHRTSISMEAEFWEALKAISLAHGKSVPELVGEIDANRSDRNLSSAIRVFVLEQFQSAHTQLRP